jgi:multiple sugar transport system ATP-binding protein
MADVEYDAISKFYGAVEVMRDLTLSIPHGRFAVLLGASGCGKTTLLRMTAGLETITAGELRIDGLRMNEVHPRNRNIAMVFQNYALYPTMKVFDNIAFSLQIKRLPATEVRARVLRAAEMLNLTPFLDRYPRELSGGQRQRVAMGRAMVRDADVFLFDEPLSNLDAKLRAQMRIEIRRLHDKLGATTIYVTHDQIEAMTMADTIVLMRGGRIEQVGTPEELYDRPVSRFAADFIGTPSMNFISGRVGGEDGNPVFESAGFRLLLPSDMPAHLGQEVICGIRPADVSLDPDGPIEGELVIAEKTGADLHLHLSIAGHDFIAITSREAGVTAGTRLRLAVPPAKVHLFDAATEIRV